MKKTLIALIAAGSIVTGATAGAAGSYFWLGKYAEEVKADYKPEIAQFIGQQLDRASSGERAALVMAEEEKEYIRQETRKYLEERKEKAAQSAGWNEMEIEQQIAAEADQMIAEINAWIDKEFEKAGY